MEEARFAMLRPAQVVKRRDEAPVVYVPLGALEWHSLHNPMGADGLQAEALALKCAQKGGVVFPVVFYGESRVNSLLETDKKYQEGIAQRLKIDAELLSEERFPFSGMEQLEHYQHHLIHIMAQAASYGFKLAVFIAGHYPLIEHARSAIITYNQWAYDKAWTRIGGMAVTDYLVLKDKYTSAGDHAGGWETSHLLASHPDTVNLSLAKDEMQYGVFTTRNPLGSTAAFGEEIYTAAAKEIVERAKEHLRNPGQYVGHGMRLE